MAFAPGVQSLGGKASALNRGRGFNKLNKKATQVRRIANTLKKQHKKMQGISNVLGKNHPMYKTAGRRSAKAFSRLQKLKSKHPEYFVSRGGR